MQDETDGKREQATTGEHHGKRDLPSLLATLAALDRASLASKRPVTVPLLKTWLTRANG